VVSASSRATYPILANRAAETAIAFMPALTVCASVEILKLFERTPDL
jgi:hypothetical protein